MLQHIVEICTKEKARWPTSLEEDRRLLKDGKLDSRARVGLQFRIQKKQVLCSCFRRMLRKAGLGSDAAENERVHEKLQL